MAKADSRRKRLAIFNAVAFAIILAVNGLANALPINGVTTGDISDKYYNLFVPAGFTFSIWGVIYLLLLLHVIYQLRAAFNSSVDGGFINRIGWLFVLNGLANAAWIFLWHHEMLSLSVFVMLLILGSLILIYKQLGIGLWSVPISEKIFVHIPFSVYLGWITVATIANISAFLVSVDWAGFGIAEVSWAVFVLSVGVLIALNVIGQRSDVFYGLVIVWAYFGIVMGQGGGFDFSNTVVLAATIGMGVVGVMVAYVAVTTIFR